MKIAFWSNGGEKMCVTANMASIASMVSLRNAGRVKEILLENHLAEIKVLKMFCCSQCSRISLGNPEGTM